MTTPAAPRVLSTTPFAVTRSNVDDGPTEDEFVLRMPRKLAPAAHEEIQRCVIIP